MSKFLLETDRQREEFFKIAIYLILVDDLDRELTGSEEKALNSIFFDINFFPEYTSSNDLYAEKKTELNDIKDRVSEVCIENSELFYKLLDENVFKELYTLLETSSDSTKNLILMKLYFTVLNYFPPNDDQERFLEYIIETLDVDEELIDCLTEASSEIRALIDDAKGKGGIE